jgi:predicted DNA-binding transcriptional regulator AlpA
VVFVGRIVVLAIFDHDLPSALRLDMVSRLLCISRPTRYISQKPKFPKFDQLLIDFPRKLITFLGPRSWLLFDLLNLKEEQLDWMHSTSVDSWEKMTGYKTTEKIVRSLEVVNDCAERGIKLVSDFKDVCKDVKEQEALFQVIENHRNHFSSATKQNLKGVV